MEDVAGYRVLRSAGHGDRTRLLLGYDEGRTVVLKVSDAGDPGHDVEIEALSRAAGEHVVRLDDVASDGRTAVLVLERLAAGRLDELLDRRGALEAGEAVTILAPLAATLDRIHAAGVAHGALSLASIGFRADGAPTLTGFGRAELFAPGSPEVIRETVPGVLADRAALRGIVEIVLARVAGERSAAAARLATQLRDASPESIGRAVFDLATPVPVRFDDEPADVALARVGELQPTEADPDESRVRLPAWLLGVLPDGVRERAAEAAGSVLRVWAASTPRRRRLLLGLAAGGLTALAAFALVPAGTAGPTVARPAPTPTDAEAGASSLPDDPVQAAVLLLALRERCIRDLSILCLDDVVQPGSAAAADDVALIRAIQDGGEHPGGTIVPGEPVLVERLGDSALLDLPPGSDPASVLLLRTKNGWRLRQYLNNEYADAPAGTAGPG